MSKKFFQYFVRGLIFLTPIGVTVLLILSVFSWIDEQLHMLDLKGIWLFLFVCVLIVIISAIGYFGSNIFIRPISDALENLIKRIPLINFIYGSLKDITSAFYGEKRKFDKPVRIIFNNETGLSRVGFITQEDLSVFKLEDMIAVYVPHSYAFSGNIYIVPRSNIHPIDASSGDVMRFIVSGGVAGFNEDDEEQEIKKDDH